MKNQTATVNGTEFTFPAGYKSVAHYIDALEHNVALMQRNARKYSHLIARDLQTINLYKSVGGAK